MRRSADFRRTVRRGARAGRPTMVVHCLVKAGSEEPAMVGFVVSGAVGNAVQRNRVKRRLRGLIAEKLVQIPRGSQTVVRALPRAHKVSYPELRRDFGKSLSSSLDKAQSVRAEGSVG